MNESIIIATILLAIMIVIVNILFCLADKKGERCKITLEKFLSIAVLLLSFVGAIQEQKINALVFATALLSILKIRELFGKRNN